MGGREKTKMSINAMGALDAARGAPSASRLGKTRGERARGVLRIVVVAAIIGISYWKHRQALAEEERLRVENEQRIQEEQRAQEEKRIQEEKRVQEEKAKADERRRKEEERKRASKQQPAPGTAPSNVSGFTAASQTATKTLFFSVSPPTSFIMNGNSPCSSARHRQWILPPSYPTVRASPFELLAFMHIVYHITHNKTRKK